jgi:hypothetical protein
MAQEGQSTLIVWQIPLPSPSSRRKLGESWGRLASVRKNINVSYGGRVRSACATGHLFWRAPESAAISGMLTIG